MTKTLKLNPLLRGLKSLIILITLNQAQGCSHENASQKVVSNSVIPLVQAQFEPYNSALNKEAQAIKLTEKAKRTKFNDAWRSAVNSWKEAAEIVATISPDNLMYSVAQQKVGEYDDKIQNALSSLEFYEQQWLELKRITNKIAKEKPYGFEPYAAAIGCKTINSKQVCGTVYMLPIGTWDMLSRQEKTVLTTMLDYDAFVEYLNREEYAGGDLELVVWRNPRAENK